MRNIPFIRQMGIFAPDNSSDDDTGLVAADATEHLQAETGPAFAGQKRPASGSQDGRGNKKRIRREDDPAAAARLFDSTQNFYAMEYMKQGDVGIPFRKVGSCAAIFQSF